MLWKIAGSAHTEDKAPCRPLRRGRASRPIQITVNSGYKIHACSLPWQQNRSASSFIRRKIRPIHALTSFNGTPSAEYNYYPRAPLLHGITLHFVQFAAQLWAPGRENAPTSLKAKKYPRYIDPSLLQAVAVSVTPLPQFRFKNLPCCCAYKTSEHLTSLCL